MKRLVIKVETWEEMVAWGKELAQRIDEGKPLVESCIRAYLDPDDLNMVFTPARRALLASIQQAPGTMQELATRLNRPTEEVAEDVRALNEVDIFKVRQGRIHLIADEIVFEPLPISA